MAKVFNEKYIIGNTVTEKRLYSETHFLDQNVSTQLRIIKGKNSHFVRFYRNGFIEGRITQQLYSFEDACYKMHITILSPMLKTHIDIEFTEVGYNIIKNFFGDEEQKSIKITDDKVFYQKN